MKLAKKITGVETPGLEIKTFYSLNSLTGRNVGYLLYRSTSHGINLAAEKATGTANYYW